MNFQVTVLRHQRCGWHATRVGAAIPYLPGRRETAPRLLVLLDAVPRIADAHRIGYKTVHADSGYVVAGRARNVR